MTSTNATVSGPPVGDHVLRKARGEKNVIRTNSVFEGEKSLAKWVHLRN